jgi:DNA repair protein RadC
VDLTQKLRDLLKLMDVALLDHIIIAGDRYISLADKGCL